MSSWLGGEMSGRNTAFEIEWNTTFGGLTAAPSNSNAFHSEDKSLLDWGDGTPIEEFSAATIFGIPVGHPVTHTYASGGTYRIRQWLQNTRSNAEADQPTWRTWRWGQKAGLTEIVSFGRNPHVAGGWNSLLDFFLGCTNMKATYLQDYPRVVSTAPYVAVSRFFENAAIGACGEYNPQVWSNWGALIKQDATSLAGFFRDINGQSSPNFNKSGWNPDLTSWDTPRATSMANMFDTCISFDRDIGHWDTSNVTNLSLMFVNAKSFNNGGSTSIGSWNTSNVTNFTYCFLAATSFNQPIGSWDTSSGTNMQVMFQQATSFNNGGLTSIDSWDVSNVTSFQSMFNNAVAFNQPIGSWDVSNSSTFWAMFLRARSFDQDLSAWSPGTLRGTADVSMRQMFYDARDTNWNTTGIGFNNGGSTGIDSWDTSKVNNMSEMFYSADNFNQPIGSWDVSNVTTMYGMFRYADSFNQDIGSWNVSAVETMAYMLEWTTSFDQDISSWSPSTTNADFTGMLNYSGMSVENYSKWLIALANWAYDNGYTTAETLGATNKKYNNTTYTGIGSGQYTNAVSARAYLVSLGWTITDGGQI